MNNNNDDYNDAKTQQITKKICQKKSEIEIAEQHDYNNNGDTTTNDNVKYNSNTNRESSC